MHKTKIDLSVNVREKSIAVLNARLADAIDLYSQCKQAHWNVKGPNFIALHELFDKIAEDVEDYTDTLAERITSLGGTAEGTLQIALDRTQLTSYPLTISSGEEHVEALSTAMALFGKAVRGAIDESATVGDQDTADVFTEVSRGVDKYLWFLEAHLQADR